MPPRRPPLAMLIAVTAIGPLSLNIFVPSMPGLMRVFGAEYTVVQLTLTLYMLGLAVAQLAYGPLSDRWGRRPVLLAGLGLYLLGTALCLVAPTIEVLIAGRVVQAVGGCAGLVVGRAIVRDLYQRDRAASVLAYVTMAMVVAPMLAPTIGGFLDDLFGWQASFAFLLAVGVIVLGAAVPLLHETHRPEAGSIGATRALLAGFARVLAIPAFLGYALQVAFTTSAFFTFLGGAPYVMVRLMGRPASEYGLYFVLISGAYMAGNFATGRLSLRFGADRLIAVGTMVSLFGTVLLVGLAGGGLMTPLSLFGAMAFVSFGNGLSVASGLAGAVSVDPRHAGAASGLAGFLQMAIAAGFSWLVGALLAETALPLALVMATAAALAPAAYLVGVRVLGAASR